MEITDLLLTGPFPLVFAFGALVLSVWDSRHEEEPDKQIGIKIVLFSLCLFGATIALQGLTTLLEYVMAGAKGDGLKPGISGLVSGGGITLFIYTLFVPRTNHEDEPGVTRMAMGYAALSSGVVTILSFSTFASTAIGGGAWALISPPLVNLLVYGGVFYVALTKFGDSNGWEKPVPAPALQNPGYGQQQPMAGYPQQPGMPQQPAGYPPQAGMPQQGGMPQQAGLPQPGGYPPQAGAPPQPQQPAGYPPQGGGGYPPQGGGGYPPR